MKKNIDFQLKTIELFLLDDSVTFLNSIINRENINVVFAGIDLNDLRQKTQKRAFEVEEYFSNENNYLLKQFERKTIGVIDRSFFDISALTLMIACMCADKKDSEFVKLIVFSLEEDIAFCERELLIYKNLYSCLDFQIFSISKNYKEIPRDKKNIVSGQINEAFSSFKKLIEVEKQQEIEAKRDYELRDHKIVNNNGENSYNYSAWANSIIGEDEDIDD